jgi:hypothetical protein
MASGLMWTDQERLKAIHYSIWFFGVVQMASTVAILMAVMAR